MCVSKVLGMSIWTYQGPDTAKVAKQTVIAATEQITPRSNIWLPILAMYTPVHLFSFVVVFSFILLPIQVATAFWVGALVVYYAITGQNSPQHTGESSAVVWYLAAQRLCKGGNHLGPSQGG